VKIRIVAQLWKIVLQTPAEFNQTHGDAFAEAAAVTDANTWSICFRNDSISIETVRHELFHAYWEATLTKDCSLTMDQSEELAAQVVGRYGEELVRKARKVHKYLIKGKLDFIAAKS